MGKTKFFRLTNWYAERRDILFWFFWMSRRDVPVALVRWDRRVGGVVFSVWRGGTDRVDGDATDIWRPEYVIVEEAHSFKALLPEGGTT